MTGVDSTFRALADRRRRDVLSCLQEHHQVSLADVAEYVVEERCGDVAEVPADRVRSVYFDLYHKHIPQLQDAGLVDYDQEDDLVARTDRTPAALERARESVDAIIGAHEVP